ncbi:MAG: hypothetical protein WDW38_011092 [Sanguina aurantia]
MELPQPLVADVGAGDQARAVGAPALVVGAGVGAPAAGAGALAPAAGAAAGAPASMAGALASAAAEAPPGVVGAIGAGGGTGNAATGAWACAGSPLFVGMGGGGAPIFEGFGDRGALAGANNGHVGGAHANAIGPGAAGFGAERSVPLGVGEEPALASRAGRGKNASATAAPVMVAGLAPLEDEDVPLLEGGDTNMGQAGDVPSGRKRHSGDDGSVASSSSFARKTRSAAKALK